MSETKIKERPILFSAPMVRAILDGRKTHTRRVVNNLNPTFVESNPTAVQVNNVTTCPYGSIGDRLWVRETWHANRCFDEKSPSMICDGCMDSGYRVDRNHPACDLWYPADDSFRRWGELDDGPHKGKTRVSIHMPRWASRITLEITGVRVERLHDISEEDAIAEGCQCAGVPASLTNVGAFAKLWELINGKGSWAVNPWVWVIEFEAMSAQ